MPLSVETPLVLGSASPRRREILHSLKIPFVALPANADEAVLAGETAAAYLSRIVETKLRVVRALLSPDLAARAAAVLVADTSVIVDGAILGKPENEAEARAMILRLAGRTHEVHTRFAIGRPSAGGDDPLHAETVVTRVTFRALSLADVSVYAASGEGVDKAGGYAVQGLAAAFVPRIDGSYSNVVGLPACEVVVALGRLGLS
jgi:nucleoside triphosphate pyrophosphatase